SILGGAGEFNNQGTFIKRSVAFTVINLAFNNTGTVEVQTGAWLRFIGGGARRGSRGGGGGAALGFCGRGVCLYSFDAASSIRGAGTVSFSPDDLGRGSTVNVAGTYDVAGTTLINRGTVNFFSDARTAQLTLNNGGTLAVSGSLTVTGTATLAG